MFVVQFVVEEFFILIGNVLVMFSEYLFWFEVLVVLWICLQELEQCLVVYEVMCLFCMVGVGLVLDCIYYFICVDCDWLVGVVVCMVKEEEMVEMIQGEIFLMDE